MWARLRTFALFFLQYRPGQHTVAQIRAVQNLLFQYAEFAEANLGGKLLTVLLHRAVVHLPEWVIDALPGAFVREDWGERDVRRCKAGITGHATKKVAEAAASLCCTEMGLANARVEHPELHEPIAELTDAHSVRLQDDGDAYGVQLHALKDAFKLNAGAEVCYHMHLNDVSYVGYSMPLLCITQHVTLVSACAHGVVACHLLLVSKSRSLQVTAFCEVLTYMESQNSRHSLRIEGDLAIAKKLKKDDIQGYLYGKGYEGCAKVQSSDTASIQSGAALVRTVQGSNSHGRTKTDHFIYIPFMKRSRGCEVQQPCIMKVKQILLIEKAGMGWPDNKARLAVGTMYDKLNIAKLDADHVAGLETDFNEDATKRAVCVPRVLWAKTEQLLEGYPWAVHLRQVHCPVVHLPGTSWEAFVTFNKIGYHGCTDLLDS